MKFIISIVLILCISTCFIQSTNLKTETENKTTVRPEGRWYTIKSKGTNKCLWAERNTQFVQQRDCNANDKKFWWNIQKHPKLSGNWVRIIHHTGFMIDAQWGGRHNGNKFWLYSQNWTSAQNFLMSGSDGNWRFVNKISSRCLDVPGNNRANGMEMIQWDCHNGHNQKWIIDKVKSEEALKPVIPFKYPQTDVYGHFKLADSNQCLEAKGNKGLFSFARCNENNQNQKFKLRKSGHFLTIENKSNLTLDVQWGGRSNGNLYWLYSHNGTPAQKFSLQPAGKNFLIVNQGSNRCLSLTNKNQLIQFDCRKQKNQIFTFKIMEETKIPTPPKPKPKPIRPVFDANGKKKCTPMGLSAKKN